MKNYPGKSFALHSHCISRAIKPVATSRLAKICLPVTEIEYKYSR
jgi:hypothetical protein